MNLVTFCSHEITYETSGDTHNDEVYQEMNEIEEKKPSSQPASKIETMKHIQHALKKMETGFSRRMSTFIRKRLAKQKKTAHTYERTTKYIRRR